MTIDPDVYRRGNITFPVNYAADVPRLAELEATAGREIPTEIAGLRETLGRLSPADREDALALLEDQGTPAATRITTALRQPGVFPPPEGPTVPDQQKVVAAIKANEARLERQRGA